jgi:hypothetical protein
MILAGLLLFASVGNAAPVVYTTEASFKAALEAVGYSLVSESFENDTVWAASRNSISAPGSTASVISKGIRWTSNYPQNNIATGDVGGSAPVGTYAIYSLPHGLTTDSPSEAACNGGDVLPEHCYQNDGLKIESENGEWIFGFGGRIDTANSGKITFILDGIDIFAFEPDNVDNWQRKGEFADNWTFIGVIDEEGFLTAELREIRGKDWQQVLMFCDDFTIGTAQLYLDSDGDGIRDGLDPNPIGFDDNSCDKVGPVTLGNLTISNEVVYCASQGGVTVQGSVQITGTGALVVITPNTTMETGFEVNAGGKLSVYSETLP